MQQLAFKLGPFSIHWYGILVAMGFIAGLWSAARRAPRNGIERERVLDLGPWLIIGALIGARLLFVVSYWDREFAGKPWTEVFMIQHGGLVYYGGLVGASLACILYVKLKKLPIWKMADVLAPSIALGYVFGRVGCLMNGCCYGRQCELPWAIRFPDTHETYPHWIHPTQIYDSLLSLGLFLALEWMYRRKKFDGQVFAAYLVGYAVLRSIVESFRGDYPRSYYLAGWLTPAHQVSIGIVITGVVLWVLLRKRTVSE